MQWCYIVFYMGSLLVTVTECHTMHLYSIHGHVNYRNVITGQNCDPVMVYLSCNMKTYFLCAYKLHCKCKSFSRLMFSFIDWTYMY